MGGETGHLWLTGALPPSPSGVNSPVKMAPDLLQTVVQRGLAARAHQLSANSSALEETILGHRERLGLGEYFDLGSTLTSGTRPCSFGMVLVWFRVRINRHWTCLPYVTSARWLCSGGQGVMIMS